MAAQFNVADAIARLTSAARPSSIGSCAMYVRLAMEAGGLNTSTRPDWAWKYIQWLPSQGWGLVAKCSTKQEQLNFVPKPGDIAVYQKPGYGTSKPGHICMWSGTKWISDFVQNSMFVYNSLGISDVYIFRYGEQTNTDINLDEIKNSVFKPNSNAVYSGGDGKIMKGFNQPNTVMQLSSNGERDDVIQLDDGRKQQFTALRESLKSNMINMGRTVIESSEMYNSSILKTTQTAKGMRS